MLNILYILYFYPAYVSKYNSHHEKQVILLMISNREKEWHYLAVKKQSALLRGITSKHPSDFYCLNCLHFFVKKKLSRIKKYVKNYCVI